LQIWLKQEGNQNTIQDINRQVRNLAYWHSNIYWGTSTHLQEGIPAFAATIRLATEAWKERVPPMLVVWRWLCN